jgi:hypothetical protein
MRCCVSTIRVIRKKTCMRTRLKNKPINQVLIGERLGSGMDVVNESRIWKKILDNVPHVKSCYSSKKELEKQTNKTGLNTRQLISVLVMLEYKKKIKKMFFL